MINKKFSLNSNQLKVIAMLAMAIDHIGLFWFNNFMPMRIIGRLAFPIFAYMIAEGCVYTKNKSKYLLRVFTLGALCQLVYFLADPSMYLGVLITFSVSFVIIYALQWAQSNKNKSAMLVPIFISVVIAGICYLIPYLFPKLGFRFDYGFFGIMLPVLISAAPNKKSKLAMTALGLFFVCLDYKGVQWWSLLSIILLALYNGERGKARLKYVFYLFYPIHLAVIYSVSFIVSKAIA